MDTDLMLAFKCFLDSFLKSIFRHVVFKRVKGFAQDFNLQDIVTQSVCMNLMGFHN